MSAGHATCLCLSCTLGWQGWPACIWCSCSGGHVSCAAHLAAASAGAEAGGLAAGSVAGTCTAPHRTEQQSDKRPTGVKMTHFTSARHSLY